MAKKGKLTDKLIVFGRDLIKGYTLNNQYSNFFSTVSPWQMISLEEKTEEWMRWNLDWFEFMGLSQVNKNKPRILRNRRMASGILDPNDYIAREGEHSHLTSILLDEDNYDPLQQFYPLAPPIVGVLMGEFEKRDKSVQIECTDPYTINEKIQYKQDLLNGSIHQYELFMKEKALKEIGIFQVPDEVLQQSQDPKLQEMNSKYQQQMYLQKRLIESEQKYKTYKHKMEEWGQHVLNVDTMRFNSEELESEAFKECITNAKEFWHIDLMEDDYKLEFLDSANCFWHKSPNIKYVSQGDYFGWFEEMTMGDIVNKLGKKMTNEQFDHFADYLNRTMTNIHSGAILTNDQKAYADAYYDATKPDPFGRKNPAIEDIKERKYWENFENNFKNASSYEMLAGLEKNAGQPKIFRVMRLYWKSQKKIGWLTKIGKDGVPIPGMWIDENFKVTENPIYDFTVTKEKTKENLVYGEHIDWEWINEWRHGIKISANISTTNTFWRGTIGEFQPIYIDGLPVKFQFKGKNNVYESYPPIEGCEFNTKGIRPVSFIDLLSPFQITYNICENKKASIMVNDFGKILAHNQATIPRNRPGNVGSQDYINDFYDEIARTKILPTNVDKDIIQLIGQNANQIPQVVDMSLVNEALQYDQLGKLIKEEAMEAIGVTRQRMGQQKASETATGINGAINYSEVQTESLFVQHSVHLMPRVYQRMLEAAQFYLYQNKTSKIAYRNSEEQNQLMEIENLDNLLRDYNVRATNKPRLKFLKEKLEQLFLQDNTLEASPLDRAQVMTSVSVNEILNKLKEAQARKEVMDEEKQKHEQEMQQAQIDAEREALEKQLMNENEQKRLDRESNEKIAMLRELAGLQTDVNTNSIPDSQDNLDYYMKMQQMESSNKLSKDKLGFDKQKHQDSLNLEREKLMAKKAIEDKKLQIAKTNRNKYSK